MSKYSTKNDLTAFEQNLLEFLNVMNSTKYTYKNLMEWSSSEKIIDSNLASDEIKYNVLGVYVAIKP